MNLLNYGSGYQTWVEFLAIGLFVFIVLWASKPVWNLLWNKAKFTKKKTEKLIKVLIFRSCIVAVSAIFLFLAYGNINTQNHRIVQDQGMMELVNKMPDQKPIDTIRKEADNYVDPLLKQQDSSSAEKQKLQADRYLTEALERAKERSN